MKNEIPTSVKMVRLKHGDTLSNVGELLGLTVQTCSKLEKNTDLLNIGQVKKLAERWKIESNDIVDIFFSE